MKLEDIEVDEFYRINKFYPEKDFRGKTIKVIAIHLERPYQVRANLLTPTTYYKANEEVPLTAREVSKL